MHLGKRKLCPSLRYAQSIFPPSPRKQKKSAARAPERRIKETIAIAYLLFPPLPPHHPISPFVGISREIPHLRFSRIIGGFRSINLHPSCFPADHSENQTRTSFAPFERFVVRAVLGPPIFSKNVVYREHGGAILLRADGWLGFRLVFLGVAEKTEGEDG